ncbi:MAG: helix-turn-helix domain-containing protein [Gammaproteobacteria bacterium]|nr:helix-turn-helix domain-containing protein [Gammaproteobacteria bacterium]MBD3776855.1 helix-turn-helix domain-containing protein [Thiotrichales bacterium]
MKLVTHQFEEPSQQAAIQDWLPLEYVQITPGPYRGYYQAANLGESLIVVEQQNQLIQKLGTMADDACTVSLACRAHDDMRFSHFRNDAAQGLFLLPAKAQFDVVVPPMLRTVYVRLNQSRLLADLRTLNPAFWSKTPRRLSLIQTPQKVQLMCALLDVIDALVESPAASPEFTARLQKELYHSLTLMLNQADPFHVGSFSEVRKHRDWLYLLKRSREYIEAQFAAGENPTVVDICGYLQVSQRTLQNCFYKHLHISPIKYLRILRLNRVRAELQRSHNERSVTDVAMQWGFLHLGKFAQDYRQMFCERPSETLAKGGH